MKKILTSIIIMLLVTPYANAESAKGNIINITQTPCQFLESEFKDKKFKSNSKADCEKINNKTKNSRALKTLTLKPGKYTFRVTNKGIPYEVGFYLRGQGLSWITNPRSSGGGLFQGVTKDFTVDLTKGEYFYSCPLNTTPDYVLVVK